MAGCCGREGGSRWVGFAVWVMAGLVLLGIWVVRHVDPADPVTPAHSVGSMTDAPLAETRP